MDSYRGKYSTLFFKIKTWPIRTWFTDCQTIRTFLRTLTRKSLKIKEILIKLPDSKKFLRKLAWIKKILRKLPKIKKILWKFQEMKKFLENYGKLRKITEVSNRTEVYILQV